MAIDTDVQAELQRKAKDHLWLHFSSMGNYRDTEVPIIERGEGPYLFDVARQALPRHAQRAVHGADRLLLRRGARPGRAGADAQAPVLHQLDVRAPARRRARRQARRARAARASTARSSSRAAPRRSSRPGSWRASTTPPTASPCGARSSRARSPTTARRWARSRSPASPSIRTPFEPLVDGVRHVANTNRYRCKYCSDAQRVHARVRGRGGRDDRAGGPRDRRHGDHGAGAELGWHVHAAPRIPPARARDLRPLRRAAGRRRGHLRLRAPGRVVRLRALRLRARPDHVRQGPDERLRVARRGADLGSRGRALRRARRVLPARHHVRRAPDGDRDRDLRTST